MQVVKKVDKPRQQNANKIVACDGKN